MTVFKLALANLATWTRDQCFPASYAHATWARLAPFFQLEKQLHLPDGRLLLFSLQEMARPILHQQQRLNA